MDAGTLVERAAARLAAEEGWLRDPELRKLPEVAAILKAPDDVRLECVLMLAAHMFDEHDETLAFCGRRVLPAAAREPLPLSAEDVAALLSLVRGRSWNAAQLVKSLRGQIEASATGWSAAARDELGPLIENAAIAVDHPATATALRRLVAAESGLPLGLIATGDNFCAPARAAFDAAGQDAAPVLEHLAAYPATGRPPAAWKEEAARLRAPVALVAALLDALLDAGDVEWIERSPYGDYTAALFLADGNQPLACGIAVLAGTVGDTALIPRVGRLTAKAVTVIGGEYGGPRSLRLANACLHAIAAIGGQAAIAELVALDRTTRHGSLRREVGKALDALAREQGLARDELLEHAVERHGLERDGTRTVALSRGAARIEAGATGAALAFIDEGGNPRKSFPAAVRERDGDTIAGLRAELNEIRKTIAGERHRIDGLLALDRRWALADWRALYLDHPVTGRLARALIWRFGDVAGLPLDDGTVLTGAGERATLPDGCDVRLWHPLGAGDVAAWRELLLARRIAQPVKQAFREVYPAAPDERGSDSTGRFAGHVFLQARARALMKARGWTATALAWWDDGVDHGTARRDFDAVRAELAFDPIEDVEPEHDGDLYPLCTTGAVRFSAADGRPVALGDVPPLVLSEALRDVDLFIAVASIGADPRWAGRGFDAYWQSFGFGALGQPATIRRAVIEHLLPGLAIAGRCHLDDRFLVVRGDLRAYRIHLGSGNVLMEPGSVHLHVDGRRAVDAFVPFDDDPLLGRILATAHLLAGDARIDDASLAAQIRGG